MHVGSSVSSNPPPRNGVVFDGERVSVTCDEYKVTASRKTDFQVTCEDGGFSGMESCHRKKKLIIFCFSCVFILLSPEDAPVVLIC